MDIGFHILSSGWLAHRLGERRKWQLLLAVLIGILPDLIALIGRDVFGWRQTYRWTHSLVCQAPLLLLLLRLNSRIAWGGMLHIGVDVITHTYATRYLLFPFASFYAPVGITWYHGPGWLIWAVLWVVLLALIRREHYRRAKSR